MLVVHEGAGLRHVLVVVAGIDVLEDAPRAWCGPTVTPQVLLDMDCDTVLQILVSLVVRDIDVIASLLDTDDCVLIAFIPQESEEKHVFVGDLSGLLRACLSGSDWVQGVGETLRWCRVVVEPEDRGPLGLRDLLTIVTWAPSRELGRGQVDCAVLLLSEVVQGLEILDCNGGTSIN